MNVGDWLRSLGLGQYEATFRDSEIDADVLPELTDNDLEKLGVPLGHRKRLLRAIAYGCSGLSMEQRILTYVQCLPLDAGTVRLEGT